MGQLCSLQRRERERERGRGDALHVVVGVAERDPALGDALDGERVASDGERLLLDQPGCGDELEVGLAGESALAVLLLLGLEDVGGAAIAGEQVLAVLGVEEAAERGDATGDEQEVVGTADLPPLPLRERVGVRGRATLAIRIVQPSGR